MPPHPERLAGHKLVESGTLVQFEVTGTSIDESVGGDEVLVRIDLQLGVEDEHGDRTDDHEWGGLGLIFCLALLSFGDARPRGYSDNEFQSGDEFTVADFLEHLRYERGEIRFAADYIRGRCMKTDVTIRSDGTATLSTRCRGEAATRWIQRLEGKTILGVAE